MTIENAYVQAQTTKNEKIKISIVFKTISSNFQNNQYNNQYNNIHAIKPLKPQIKNLKLFHPHHFQP